MESTNYTGEEKVRLANEQALRGDVGGALVDGGITRAGESVVRDPLNTNVITSDALSGATPYKIPEVSNTSVADSIVAQTGAQAEMSALQREQQQKLTEAQTATNEARSGYRGVIDKVLGVVGSRGKLEEEAKISEKTVASDEARIALETSQRAMTNELRALSGRGLTDVQKAAEQREITRKYAFEQADLSLTLDVAERRLDRAQKTIDRKIELQLEPLKYELEFNKSFYEENKDLLSKADQRLFDTKIKELEKTYETEKEDKRAVADIQKELLKGMMDGKIGYSASLISEVGNAGNATEANGIISSRGINLGGGSGVVSGDNASYMNALMNASLGLPENQRKENQTRMQNFLKQGDLKSAKELLIRTAFAGQTGTQKEDTIKRQNAIDALGTIKSALDEYVAKSGDTNIAKGNLQALTQKLGSAGDPKLAAIGTKITLALQQYRNAVTGAAWGEQETDEYEQIFPSFKNTNKLNGAIITAMQESMSQFQEGTLSAYIGSDTYNSIFKNNAEVGGTTTPSASGESSDDEAYQLYLQSTGQSSQDNPAPEEEASLLPDERSLFPSWGGANGISLGSLFKF